MNSQTWTIVVSWPVGIFFILLTLKVENNKHYLFIVVLVLP